MFTYLDLLIVVALSLIAFGLVSLALMFLLRNQTAKRVCFYLASALAIYLGYVGMRINWPGFTNQVVLGAVMALVGIGALVLTFLRKGDAKVFRTAQIMTAASVVVGIANAFLI